MSEIIGTMRKKVDGEHWPVGRYAPGSYCCKCIHCERAFIGDKRAAECPDCIIQELVKRLTAAEAEQDKILAQAESKEKDVQLLLGLADILDQHGLMPSSAGLMTAARECRARIMEQAAKIADHHADVVLMNPFGVAGARMIADAIRALTNGGDNG